MGAVRKISHTRQMPDFRRRLQRALSLSSSESEYSRSPSRSLSGDTTEEESSTHSNNNDQAVPQQDDPPSNHEHRVLPARQYDGHGSQPDLSRDSNMLTLKCVAELDVRVKSLDRKLTDQSKCIEDIRKDLANICSRLEVLETQAEERTKCEPNHAPDEQGKTTVRTRSSQR